MYAFIWTASAEQRVTLHLVEGAPSHLLFLAGEWDLKSQNNHLLLL